MRKEGTLYGKNKKFHGEIKKEYITLSNSMANYGHTICCAFNIYCDRNI